MGIMINTQTPLPRSIKEFINVRAAHFAMRNDLGQEKFEQIVSMMCLIYYTGVEAGRGSEHDDAIIRK